VVTIAYFTPDQEKDRTLFTDPETGVDMEVVDQVQQPCSCAVAPPHSQS
jgi:hypothetical protein